MVLAQGGERGVGGSALGAPGVEQGLQRSRAGVAGADAFGDAVELAPPGLQGFFERAGLRLFLRRGRDPAVFGSAALEFGAVRACGVELLLRGGLQAAGRGLHRQQ